MARISKKWWGNKEKSIEDNASAIAFIAWRAAQEVLLNLENSDFQTDTLKQRMDVIQELLFFLTHIADRWSYGNLDDEKRQTFIISMAKNNARTLQSSMEDIDGVKDYKQNYFDLLNQRLSDYSELPYDGDKEDSSFQMRAYLGACIAEVMGDRNNKWIQDQVVEIEGFTATDILKKGFMSLMKPAFNA
ncbi:MAG: hypothetical protein HQL46_10005 [Gammaproteobacteria bacterium]|nr:hypothetical protein [Gammaproteobacteria bacterium]